jgi:hypothetical protein
MVSNLYLRPVLGNLHFIIILYYVFFFFLKKKRPNFEQVGNSESSPSSPCRRHSLLRYLLQFLYTVRLTTQRHLLRLEPLGKAKS